MKELTCILIGGGYAGIHAVKAIRKIVKGEEDKHPLRIILIDQNLIISVKYYSSGLQSRMKRLGSR